MIENVEISNNSADLQYIQICKQILRDGTSTDDRTGVGTISTFGSKMEFDLSGHEIPLLQSKKVNTVPMLLELIWMLQGNTNAKTLSEMGCGIWNQWADQSGDLGPIYGKQWREWEEILVEPNDIRAIQHAERNGFITHMRSDDLIVFKKYHDQIKNLIDGLINKPFSRRHVVSAWNVSHLPDESLSPQDNTRQGKMSLAPCHCLVQFHVRKLTIKQIINYAVMSDITNISSGMVSIMEHVCSRMSPDIPLADDKAAELIEIMRLAGFRTTGLSCQLYQRSCDWPVGVPFNIASYSVLTRVIADIVGMVPWKFIHIGGDVHIYKDQLKLLDEQLQRPCRNNPTMKFKKRCKTIDDLTVDNVVFEGYDPLPIINYPVAT